MIHEDIDYHGLRNHGATCYLNSVLQVLFMTKDFREAVKSKTKEEDTVDNMLKRLFTNLNENETDPTEILSILGIENVYEQCDAAEYFEKILNRVEPEVSVFFKGQLTYITTCFKNHVSSEETGPFWTMPLSIADPSDYSRTYSVKHGFKEFFKSSNFWGENQMYCDECKKKADATIECRMKDYPDILTLLLKRFEYPYPCVDVPYTLQTEKYEYKLYAIVDHFGGLTGGHYTAKIKSFENQNWYDFNDSNVTKLNPQPNSTLTESSQTAYLLVYQKSHVENHTNNQSHVSAKEGVVTEARAQTETKTSVEDSNGDGRKEHGHSARGMKRFSRLPKEDTGKAVVAETKHRHNVLLDESKKDAAPGEQAVAESRIHGVSKLDATSLQTPKIQEKLGRLSVIYYDEILPIEDSLLVGQDNVLEKGEQGNVLEKGEQGNVLEKGEQGNVLEKGEQGNVLEKGEQDNVLEKGEQGNVLEKGEQGNVVEKGEQGNVLEKGEQGNVVSMVDNKKSVKGEMHFDETKTSWTKYRQLVSSVNTCESIISHNFYERFKFKKLKGKAIRRRIVKGVWRNKNRKIKEVECLGRHKIKHGGASGKKQKTRN